MTPRWLRGPTRKASARTAAAPSPGALSESRLLTPTAGTSPSHRTPDPAPTAGTNPASHAAEDASSPESANDPRWRWLLATARHLHNELDPDARLLTLTVTFTDGGQVLAYTAVGSRLLSRTVIVNPALAADAVDAATVSLDTGDVTGHG